MSDELYWSNIVRREDNAGYGAIRIPKSELSRATAIEIAISLNRQLFIKGDSWIFGKSSRHLNLGERVELQ